MKLLKFIASFKLAIVCMSLLFVLTFFCTIEQVERGLHIVLKTYFGWDSLVVRPEINGRQLPLLLPGGYWVCVVFTLNLIAGGLIRMRKGWKHAGVLISHFSMVFLMVSGAITYHKAESTLVTVDLGEENNYGFSATDYTIEVFEMVDGEKLAPKVVETKYLDPLMRFGGDDSEPMFWTSMEKRKFTVSGLPFSFEVDGWSMNAHLHKANRGDHNPAKDGRIVDGRFLRWAKYYTDQERRDRKGFNVAGGYVKVKFENGEEHDLIIQELSQPVSIGYQGKEYGFLLTRKVTALPYTIRLDDSVAEYYPGTQRPKGFSSKITRISEKGEKKAFIKMNEPMRYEGYTLFQAQMGTKDQQAISKALNSTFEVVKNPSDQGPFWAVVMCALGLLIHFCIKLFAFINASMKKGESNE